MKLIVKIVSILIVLYLIYLVWRPPLQIHLVVETSEYQALDMNLKVNGKLVFNDSVNSGTYFRSSIDVDKVQFGFCNIEVESALGNAKYSNRFFILFNRTIVLEYFNDDGNLGIPHYKGRSMHGSFYPD
jgi:hypothetical protein